MYRNNGNVGVVARRIQMIKFLKVNHNGQLKPGLLEIPDIIEAEFVDSSVDRKKIPDAPRTGTPSENCCVQTLPDTVPAHS